LDDEILEAGDAPPATPPKRGLHWVFVGADGIRAGWGVLLFVLLYLVFLFFTAWSLRPFLHVVRLAKMLPVKLGMIMEVTQLLPAILATTIMARIEGRSILAYGYQGKARAVRFLSGLVWGFIALSVFALVLWKAGLLAFDGQQLHGGAIFTYALEWGLMFLMLAVFEESTLRGYLQFTLTRGMGFWWSALLLSLLFGFFHSTNTGETPVGLFTAAAVGLVFCLSLWYTGSLWWAVGCHAGWDWAQSYFYGTSDSGLIVEGHLLGEHPTGPVLWSGGTTGPEGSLLIFALLAIMSLLMWLWWGRRVKSPFSDSRWRPAWSRKPTLKTSRVATVNLPAAS
jgi:membrane protease YdiL (CAAX protease family)